MWNHQSAQVYRTIIEPKVPGLISSFNTMKFNRVLEDLSNVFQAKLPSLANSSVTELVKDFLNGNSWDLSKALVNQEESQLDLQLQKVYPLQKPGILLRALNGSVSSVKEIIRVETEEKLEEFYLNIKKKLIKCRRLEKSFVNIGITQTYEEKDLSETCLWVPASVYHDVVNNSSRMVYGGVRVAPRIAVLQQSNIVGRLLSAQVFRAQQSVRVNSSSQAGAKLPATNNNSNQQGGRNNKSSGGNGGNGNGQPPKSGDGAFNNGARNIANALTLKTVLTLKQANILDKNGRLTASAIEKSESALKPGTILKNTSVVQELTKNGSNIKDWEKRSTESATMPTGQRIQVHYYRNKVTGEVNYTHSDFKVKNPVHAFPRAPGKEPVSKPPHK